MFDFARLMPDTSDPNLTFLLKHCLTEEDFARAQEILCDLGAVASQQMDELAETANRSTPELVQYDKRGQRIDEVVFHPAYHELEKIAYEDFAIAACTHRPGAFGWPERVSNQSNLPWLTWRCRPRPASSAPSR